MLEGTLLFLVMGLFAAMLFLNLYFRIKVYKSYKKLVQNRVEFGVKHFLNQEKMEQEIYPRYPHMREEIDTFARHIRYSVKMATVLTTLITLFGGILMYFRNH
jgi:hypothetical protein